MMTTADKIKYILDVTGWSQQALADELGASRHAVSAWKRGRVPQEKFLDRINQLYDRARKMEWERKRANEIVPDGAKVLSQGGKIVLKYHTTRINGCRGRNKKGLRVGLAV